MKLIVANIVLFIATATLTTLGAVFGIAGGIAGLCALLMLIRLQRSVDDLEGKVRAQTDEIAKVTKAASGG